MPSFEYSIVIITIIAIIAVRNVNLLYTSLKINEIDIQAKFMLSRQFISTGK